MGRKNEGRERESETDRERQTERERDRQRERERERQTDRQRIKPKYRFDKESLKGQLRNLIVRNSCSLHNSRT